VVVRVGLARLLLPVTTVAIYVYRLTLYCMHSSLDVLGPGITVMQNPGVSVGLSVCVSMSMCVCVRVCVCVDTHSDADGTTCPGGR